MNARVDSFDMITYYKSYCNSEYCYKSNYKKCAYCWLLVNTGHFISNGEYYYNIYYSEGEN